MLEIDIYGNSSLNILGVPDALLAKTMQQDYVQDMNMHA